MHIQKGCKSGMGATGFFAGATAIRNFRNAKKNPQP